MFYAWERAEAARAAVRKGHAKQRGPLLEKQQRRSSRGGAAEEEQQRRSSRGLRKGHTSSVPPHMVTLSCVRHLSIQPQINTNHCTAILRPPVRDLGAPLHYLVPGILPYSHLTA